MQDVLHMQNAYSCYSPPFPLYIRLKCTTASHCCAEIYLNYKLLTFDIIMFNVNRNCFRQARALYQVSFPGTFLKC